MAIGERRFEHRAPRSEKIAFQWIDATGQTIEMVGALVDLSQSGAQLLSVKQVPVSASIRFAIDNQIRIGTVRYCLKRMRGYAVGVLFDVQGQQQGDKSLDS
jgi:hypothetical protein